MTAKPRACIVKQNQMASFEFYSIPTELKRTIFAINRKEAQTRRNRKYYDKFVSAFESFCQSSRRYDIGEEFEFHGKSWWVEYFLSQRHRGGTETRYFHNNFPDLNFTQDPVPLAGDLPPNTRLVDHLTQLGLDPSLYILDTSDEDED